MRLVLHKTNDSKPSHFDLVGERMMIGSGPECHVRIENAAVERQSAALLNRGGKWDVVPLTTGGKWFVNERPVARGEHASLAKDSRFRLGPFEFHLDDDGDAPAPTRSDESLDDQMSELMKRIHTRLLDAIDLKAAEEVRRSHKYQAELENIVVVLAETIGGAGGEMAGVFNASEFQARVAGHNVRQRLLGRIAERQAKNSKWSSDHRQGWERIVTAHPRFEEAFEFHVDQADKRLIGDGKGAAEADVENIVNGFWGYWRTASRDLSVELRRYLSLRELKKQVKDIVMGLGPLEEILRMPGISEIMVVDSQKIYIERSGRIENTGRRFISDEMTEEIIKKIVAPIGRSIDRSQPLVDARLSNGSRVNAIIAPLAVSGPCLTIRLFPARRPSIDDLIGLGTLTPQAARFLEAAVVARKNILVSGGTGSGKTTLLNCLSGFIPPAERIVTIEDTAELRLNHEHVVRLETRMANREGKGEYSIRDLVKNSLRMRPDRIVIGECRGPEAIEMLQAMNTGHDGSLTTLHANTPRDVQLRLEVMVRSAQDLPVDAIHRQIASALHLVVQLERGRDGRRRVTHITEIKGLDERLGGVRMVDIFRLIEHPGKTSDLQPTGHLPSFIIDLMTAGNLDLNAFYQDGETGS